jgi:hypothetical protein
MRPFTGRGRRHPLKITAPAFVYARWIAEILLVEAFEKIGVTAVQGCWFKHAGKNSGKWLV